MDWASGCIPPPPMPCRMRAAISMGMLTAMPHSSEATVKMRMEMSSSRVRPMRRAIQPAAGSMMAVATR